MRNTWSTTKEGAAEAWNRRPEEDRLRAEVERLRKNCKFLLSFIPPWAIDVPPNLGSLFYGTGTYEGDLEVKERVDEIKAALEGGGE
jgi:hypothetical protein